MKVIDSSLLSLLGAKQNLLNQIAANASTPGFGINSVQESATFKEILALEEQVKTELNTSKKNKTALHIDTLESRMDTVATELASIFSNQLKTNGNSVDTDAIKVAATQNQIYYETALRLMGGEARTQQSLLNINA